jgi:hypothetical protein
MKHECNKLTNGTSWAHCSACGKRLHEEGCTAKRRKGIDCFCIFTEEYLVAVGIGSAVERASILKDYAGQEAGYL